MLKISRTEDSVSLYDATDAPAVFALFLTCTGLPVLLGLLGVLPSTSSMNGGGSYILGATGSLGLMLVVRTLYRFREVRADFFPYEDRVIITTRSFRGREVAELDLREVAEVTSMVVPGGWGILLRPFAGEGIPLTVTLLPDQVSVDEAVEELRGLVLRAREHLS
jgi:hypothetical protein